MRISIVNFAEPLPTDPSKPRWYRAGMLAKFLANNGHEVTWWASGFDHFTKKFRSKEYTDFFHETGIKICLLPTPKYKKNISFARFYNHVIAGRRLKKELESLHTKPDIIFCAFPPIETSFEAVNFGLKNNIPVIVDARDRWPELIVEQFPLLFRNILRLILKPYFMKTALTFKRSTALTGTTRLMLDFGLEMAGREYQESDRVFLMTYEKPIFDKITLQEADKFWDSFRIDNNSINLCFFGTFVNQKSVDLETCIEGFNLLNQKYKNKYKLIMCGDGPTFNDTKRIANSKNIIFTGRVSSAEIWSLMKRCQLGVLPYKPESHFLLSVPNKAAEYFAGNLPIITSLTSGMLNSILKKNEAGIFYDSGNPESFVNSIEAFAADNDISSKMKENVTDLYDSEFESNKILSSTAKWIEDIVEDFLDN